MRKRNVLLIEGRSSTARLREELAAAGCKLVVIPAGTGKLRLPLMPLPDIIVLYAVIPAKAEELIRKLRMVGFEMPAVTVVVHEDDDGGPGYSYTIDARSLDSATAVEWLTQLAMRPAIAASEVSGALRGDIADAPRSESPRPDPPLSAPDTPDAPPPPDAPDAPDATAEAPAGARAGRRRAGAAPLGRRFQSRGIAVEPRSPSAAPTPTSPPRSSCVAHSPCSPSSPSSSRHAHPRERKPDPAAIAERP